MGDLGSYSRFLAQAGCFLILFVAATQTPRPSRVPPRKAVAPIVLSARAVSTSQINLTWTNNSDKVVGLYVERSLSSKGPWKRVVDVPANASSCANGGLAAATTYYYRVVANDAAFSNVASATTLSGATDGSPRHLTATAISSNQIDLSWSEDAGEIAGFKIERCEGKGCSNFTEIATVAADPASYQNADLTALTSYSYRIRGYKKGSHYAYSNVASATTLRSTVPPSAPKDLVANVISSSQITLNWNSESVDHRAAGYNVYQYGERIGSTIGTSYTVKRLTANTEYCYSVQAFDNAGNSSFQSHIACATTKPDSNSQPQSKPTPDLR